MKQFVLDCSITISWCLPDETNVYADETLALLQTNVNAVEAVVPGIWSLEIANTLLVSERRHRMNLTQVKEAINWIESIAIVVARPMFSTTCLRTHPVFCDQGPIRPCLFAGTTRSKTLVTAW